MEANRISTDRPMGKKIWYIRTVEYYSALNRKEILTHATTWMNLEVSEISQIQKDSVSCHLY